MTPAPPVYWLQMRLPTDGAWSLVSGEDSALEFRSVAEAVAFWRDYRVEIFELQRLGDFPAGPVCFAIERAGPDDRKSLVFMPYAPEAEARARRPEAPTGAADPPNPRPR